MRRWCFFFSLKIGQPRWPTTDKKKRLKLKHSFEEKILNLDDFQVPLKQLARCNNHVDVSWGQGHDLGWCFTSRHWWFFSVVPVVAVAVDDEARSTSTLPCDSSASPASVYKIFWVPPNPERAKAWRSPCDESWRIPKPSIFQQSQTWGHRLLCRIG